MYSWWGNPICVDDDDFYAFLSEVVMLGDLVGAALGITKKVIEQGFDSLSEKQRIVFEQNVLAKYTISYCVRCSGYIPWLNMLDVVMNDGLCNHCESLIFGE